MNDQKRRSLIQYAVGIPVVGFIYLVLSIAFVGHVQGLADSSGGSVPWYYSILGFFVSFPFLHPSEFFSQILRPLFGIFAPVFGSADSAAIFIIIALQAIFWGFAATFCFRLVSKFFGKKQAPQST
jgi:hypothetical protein